MIWLLPHPLPPLPSVSSTAAIHRKSEKERHLAGGGGDWEGRSQIRRHRESLAFYASFNTLCTVYTNNIRYVHTCELAVGKVMYRLAVYVTYTQLTNYLFQVIICPRLANLCFSLLTCMYIFFLPMLILFLIFVVSSFFAYFLLAIFFNLKHTQFTFLLSILYIFIINS
jgi:hypothetical protein